MICFLAATFLLFLFQKKSDAFPSGAGSCAGGMPAVFGLHLDTTGGRTVRSATLDELGVVVLLGTTVLDVSVVNDFPIGQDLQISVSSTVDNAYKGVLVRLEAPTGVNTAAALLPGTNTAISSRCVNPIIGITHTSNTSKTISTGTIRFDSEVLNVALGITAVFVNNATTSIYAFNEFNVNFRDCTITFDLFNALTDSKVATLTNGTTIGNPPPCGQANIHAVVPCGDSDGKVTMELYQGTKKIRKATDSGIPYFMFGNKDSDVKKGKIKAGSYSIRAQVNEVWSPFTYFTLGGSCTKRAR